MALKNPRLSTNVHLLSMKQDKGQTDALKTKAPTTCVVPLSEYLWNQSEATRQETLKTYFVQGIGDGTLNPTAFGGYMVQDSVYCCLAQGSIDIAANKASNDILKAFLRHESESYTKYYKSLWDKWHIANANGIELGEACKAYATYERSVAEDMETIYFIVAMIPCLKLWPWLGKQLQGKNHGVYQKWFNDNFDPNYRGYEKLDAFVDAAHQDGKINKEQANTVYQRCMKGEYAFFDSPKAMF